MTDDEIRRLILLKSEGPNLDYKAGFTWSKDNRDKKYELIRDLIALANTKDGGRVIFGVRDEDLELVGVSAEIFESIDPTDVVSMLHDNGAPKARCTVFKRDIDGRKVIVFDVGEFDETPIICTKGISSLDGTKRVILRQGAIYIRTGAGSTEEISAPDDMRSLIARAVARKADELLKSFSDILTGRPVHLGESAAASYEPEVAAAETFLHSKLGPDLTTGHFEVIAYPTVYNAKRIGTIPEVAEAVRQSEVRLRGWNFPHTDKQNAGPFANGFQSATISHLFGRYVEGYRVYQSGLLLWKRAFWEDAEDKKSKDGRPLLSFVSAIYSFTEYLLFLSRFYERIAPEATLRFAITLRGCDGRELASFEPLVAFWEGHIAHEDVIRQEREVQLAELRASHLTIATEMVKHVLHVFDWMDVSDASIGSWQQKLIKRQF